VRLTTQMKSSLSETTRWAIGEGTLRGCFYLKVPNEKPQRELIQALKRVKDPVATYHAPRGGVLAFQWCLPREDFRSIWTSKRGQVIDG
jgi:hypothetical protein